jgi:hypothetical protein
MFLGYNYLRLESIFDLCKFMQLPTERVHISIEFSSQKSPPSLSPIETQVKYDLSLVSDSEPFI